jgi:GT2 family glycosyltransferase
LRSRTTTSCSIPTGWLDWSGRSSGPPAGLVTGLIPTAELETEAQAIFDANIGWFERLRPSLDDLGEHHPGISFFPYSAGVFGAGASFAARREALDDLGPFDEALGAGTPSGGGEDLEYFLRTILAGWTLAYEPAAIVWHVHRHDMGGVTSQVKAYGRCLGAYATKHLMSRQHGLALARRAPAALRILATERRASKAGQTISPRLRALVLLGVLEGPLAYLRGRRAARRAGGPSRG